MYTVTKVVGVFIAFSCRFNIVSQSTINQPQTNPPTVDPPTTRRLQGQSANAPTPCIWFHASTDSSIRQRLN
jgi:hypothetical protein